LLILLLLILIAESHGAAVEKDNISSYKETSRVPYSEDNSMTQSNSISRNRGPDNRGEPDFAVVSIRFSERVLDVPAVSKCPIGSIPNRFGVCKFISK